MIEKYSAVPVTVLRVLPRSVIVTAPDDPDEHVIGRSTLHYADDKELDDVDMMQLPEERTLRIMSWLAQKEGLL